MSSHYITLVAHNEGHAYRIGNEHPGLGEPDEQTLACWRVDGALTQNEAIATLLDWMRLGQPAVGFVEEIPRTPLRLVYVLAD